MEPTTEPAASNFIATLIGGSGLLCFFTVVMLFNLWTVIKMMRSKEDAASGLSKAAWATSLLAWFTGPCGLFFAFVAFVLARIETGKIWREESPISSATPCRVASINSGMLVLFTFGASILAFISM